MMELSKKEARIVKSAIGSWTKEDVITPELSNTLLNSYKVVGFDWKRVAKYSFWLAICSIVISVSAVLSDAWLMSLIQKLFNASDLVKCIGLAILSSGLYFLGLRRRKHFPEREYSNEALFFLGVLATAASIAYLGNILDTGSGHFSLLLLLASFVYAILGLLFPSKLIWIFALLSLGSWFGAETGYISGWGAYYLGMNYPMRFVLFGLVLLFVGSYVFRHWTKRAEFLMPTKIMGLLYLFIALWILSITGNYGDGESWQQRNSMTLLYWSVLFGLVAVVSIYHGVKYDDGVTRGFGVTFIFINLYTRFFEYYWDDMHKALFFGLLALSFWFLGSKAEKIWGLSMIKKVQTTQNDG